MIKITKEVFLDAYERIKDPSHWTQGWFYTDAEGNRLYDSGSEEQALSRATKWCSLGTIVQTFFNKNDLSDGVSSTVDEGYEIFDPFLPEVDNEKPFVAGEYNVKTLTSYNDTHSHEEVMALWEKVGKAKGWL